MRKALLTGLAGAMLLAAGASPAQARDCERTLDNFNRANSSNLGPNWTERAGDLLLDSNSVLEPNPDSALMTFNGVSRAAAACADVSGATVAGTNYVAIVLRYAGIDENLFIKVQDNTGGEDFDRAYFYFGNNGATFAPSQALTPFSVARMYVELRGTTVTLKLDTDFDGTADQVVAREIGPPATTGGTGFGLGSYNDGRADNFAVPVCGGRPVTHLADGDSTGGSRRKDAMDGTAAGETLKGRRGGDVLCGKRGADLLKGGRGRDKLKGGPGPDRLVGGRGNDTCRGGGGADVLVSC